MPLHVSSTSAHRQEAKIVLYRLWYHQSYTWPSGAQINLCTFEDSGLLGSHTRWESPDVLKDYVTYIFNGRGFFLCPLNWAPWSLKVKMTWSIVTMGKTDLVTVSHPRPCHECSLCLQFFFWYIGEGAAAKRGAIYDGCGGALRNKYGCDKSHRRVGKGSEAVPASGFLFCRCNEQLWCCTNQYSEWSNRLLGQFR